MIQNHLFRASKDVASESAWVKSAWVSAGLAMALLPRMSFAVDPQNTLQPVTGINYVVESAPEADLGMVEMVGFSESFLPAGAFEADGTLYSIAANESLFTQLGTTFGGNGVTDFAMPDLNGRVTIGAGQGVGLTNRNVGDQVGADSVTLTTDNLPVAAGGMGTPVNNMQPSLGLTYLIATQGVTQGGGGFNDPALGEIFLSSNPNATANPPSGFLPLDGQTLETSSFPDLFDIIGTNYGGNGTTTFQLPDLRGRTAVGAGSGLGLTPRQLGGTFGTESTTLALANLLPPDGSDVPYNNIQPSLGLQYMIALSGIYPSATTGGDFDNSAPVLGQIALFAGNIAPLGWVFCDGQLLEISTNEALFSLLSTTFGGNGFTTFALPDLQGRAGVGAVGGQGLDGLESVALGSETGTETLQILQGQEPPVNMPEPCGFGVVVMGAICLGARRRAAAKG